MLKNNEYPLFYASSFPRGYALISFADKWVNQPFPRKFAKRFAKIRVRTLPDNFLGVHADIHIKNLFSIRFRAQ